ncbi:MAG: Ger(x)C family spore germination C-terminal domain-containing protein, partial [Acutalibacteraceae bacterium]
QSDNTTETHVFSAPSVSEAIASMPEISGKIPFYANNRIIVIGSDAAAQKLNDMMDFFSRDNQMRADAYLLYAEKTAAEILCSDELSTPLSNNFIFSLLKKSVSNGKCAAMTVMQAKVCLDSKTGDVFMPIVAVSGEDDKKQLKIEKTVIYRENTVAAMLDESESAALLILRSELENPVISVSGGKEISSLEILKMEAKITVANESGHIVFKAEISGKCEITEEQGVNTDSSTENIEKIQELSENYISEMCRKMFSLSANKSRSDPAGLGRYIRKYDYTDWIKFRESRAAYLENAELRVNTNLTVVRAGQLK